MKLESTEYRNIVSILIFACATYKVAGLLETIKLAGFVADEQCIAQLNNEE